MRFHNGFAKCAPARLAVGLIVLGLNVRAGDAGVATTGEIRTEPAIPRRELRALVDDSLRTGLAFPVGSRGNGAVVFRFFRDRPVSGLRFYQNSWVYYATAYRVMADRDGDGRFETRLAAGACRPVFHWTEARWPETPVRALRLEFTAGVSKGARAHPCLAEIEVFGKALPQDSADIRRAGWPLYRISRVRSIERWIDLSGRSRPVTILYPPGAEKAAAAVAAALRARGAENLRSTRDPSGALPDRNQVIALGNVNDNELIARLYWNGYAFEDALLPGPGGWSLRTVYDPYPWHGQGNVVVLGFSRIADASRAAAAFVAALERRNGGVGIDYHLQVSSAKPPSAAEIARLNRDNAPNFRVFLRAAERYLRTGRKEYARHAIAVLEGIVKVQHADPDWFYDWPEETHSGRIMAAWDAFEECPWLTRSQRLAFTRAFLRFMRLLPRHISGYGALGKHDLITWNHTTFPLLGLYFGARYFHDYYHVADTDTYLSKARACFLAQARSWKPQEDADSYMTLTMEHTIQYCLAEWQVDLLRRTGIVRGFADYVIGFCDNRGLPAGFGDSGLARRPYLLAAVLPQAFWFTRDPGYLWVLEHTQGRGWKSPFHPEVRPVEPKRFLGLRVFPLTAQVYEYTKLHRFYAENFTPPNIPEQQAFDKISFRADWTAHGQYALLDGYSRGKHLHFDGNAIIELVDRGRRWLLDHDYLTRNTTEHNMLSIIRNGRSDQLEPSCAALLCHSDPGGRVGLATTEVRDWLGIDWRRSIFWRKGEAFVVMDRAEVRRAGDYDLDLVWKVEHRGDERLLPGKTGGTFVVRRAEADGRTRGLCTVSDPAASGGKAVVLITPDAELSFSADLPAGPLRVAVYGYGTTTSSDSVYVSIGGAPAAACGLPLNHYGPSREHPNYSGAPKTPILSPAAGRQVVTVRLRERPPVHLDRLVFFDARGTKRLCAIEAENAPPPDPADVANLPADRFFIKWADPVAARTVASHPLGIVVPVLKLFQRSSGNWRPGRVVEWANLLYTDGSRKPRDWGIRRLAPGAVRLTGSLDAVLAVRGARLPGLEYDAAMLWISPDTVAWCDGRFLRFGDCRIRAARRGSGELDVKTGRVRGAAGVTVQGVSAEAIRAWEQGLHAPPARPPHSVRLPKGKPAPLWQYRLPLGGGHGVRRLLCADLRGDGKKEIVAAAGNSACALDPANGRVLWRFSIPGICADVAVAELAPAPGREVLVAGGDSYAYILSAAGKVLSKHQIRGPAWNQNYGDHPWACTSGAVADLDGDGTPEIILGTQSMELRIFSPDWKPLALTRRAVLHGSIDFIPVDLEGNGRRELVATDHYGRVSIFGADGRRLASVYTSIGDMQAAVADIDGDGQYELAAGSSTGDFVCARIPVVRAGKKARIGRVRPIWRFDNFGYGVNRIRSADCNGDGRPDFLVASATGYLYAIGAKGKVLWQHRVGVDVTDCRVLSSGAAGRAKRILALDRSGVAVILGLDGTEKARIPVLPPPLRALLCGDRLVVGDPSGIRAYRF